MDHALEASPQRIRDHLRRPLASSRNLLMKTAGNTVAVTDPTTANGIAKATSGSDMAPWAWLLSLSMVQSSA